MKEQERALISTMLRKQWLMRLIYLHNERRSVDRQNGSSPWLWPAQCSQKTTGETRVQREADSTAYHCWLPAEQCNWTKQVSNIISAADEDRRAKAQLWGGSTFGRTWLTTHLQIHFSACQSECEAQCHCNTSVNNSNLVPVSKLLGKMSFQSNPNKLKVKSYFTVTNTFRSINRKWLLEQRLYKLFLVNIQ